MSSLSLELTTDTGDTYKFPDSLFFPDFLFQFYASEFRVTNGFATLVNDFYFNTSGHPDNSTFGIL